MYIFCHFDEVSAIRLPKIMTFSITGSQIFFANFSIFTGSQADLEGAADNLFASPPCPQALPFESLSLKTPAKTVPPTSGTALQQKIESKLKKYLGSQFNIQLQQQMGLFQASILEAMKSP